MGKNVMFTLKGCLKSVSNHPFLVCILCFLMFIYRSSPVLFSFLVSSSPVFVCTAVLLGALLSLGDPNAPESAMKDRAVAAAAAIVQNGEIRVYNDIERMDESLVEIRESMLRKKKGEESDVSMELNEYVESDYGKSDAESFDSERVNVDSPPQSPWRWMEEIRGGDKGYEEDDALDSGSDGSMSSSPTASMAAITPMLDELHPLLHQEDGSMPLVQMSLPGSRAMSEISLHSSTSGNESDVESNEDLDGETRGENDQRNPVITWTEEDQKNLQDLGSSEIERNQRLESVMQRRREWKHMSMVSDENSIDLQNSNFSVPCVLPSRNPFDTHSDSGKEKPSPSPPSSTEGGFQETSFTRHDVKTRPYLVPEMPFCQQPSDAKLSPVLETASVSSVEDTDVDHSRLVEKGNPKELEMISHIAEVTENRDKEGDKHRETEEIRTTEEPVSKKDVFEEDKDLAPDTVSELVKKSSGEQSPCSKAVGQSEMVSNETEGEEALKDGGAPSTEANSPADAYEAQHKAGKVYHSSTPSVKTSSSSFNSFHLTSERAVDLVPLPALVKRTVSPVERTSSQDIQKELSPEPSMPYSEDKHKSNGSENSGNDSDEEKHTTESSTHATALSSEGALNSKDGEKTAASDNVEEADDDNDDDFQEASVKISTPSVRESTPVFYNIRKKDLSSERLKEVQVPNTPVDPSEKLQAIPNLNIPNIQELINTRSHVGSPYTPELASMPSSASKDAGPHFIMHTILEEVSEARQTDGGSGSDSEGEVYWRARPSAFDKYVDSVEETSSLASHRLASTENPGAADGEETNVEDISRNSELDTEPSTQTNSKDGTIETEKEKVGSSADKETNTESITS